MTAILDPIKSVLIEHGDSEMVQTYENRLQTPKVYAAILKASELMPAIGKNQRNVAQKWNFRGIDDIYNRLGLPLREAGLVLGADYEVKEFVPIGKGFMAVVQGTFSLTCVEDGSYVEDVFLGQAADYGDKAISKAKSMALKYWAFQKFLIPVKAGTLEDPDSKEYEVDSTSFRDKYFKKG